VRVVGTQKIFDFVRKHTDARQWFGAWLAEARNVDWRSPSDIKKRYKSASVTDNNKVIFNVKGNNYRMEVQVSYENKIVVIKRIGTHPEYDRWDG
jgi:mRNA interferase HigB